MSDSLALHLRRAAPGLQILDGLADRVQWAADASIYRMVPRLVCFPRNVEDVQAVLAAARESKVPVCFRAGGTSLSGQAVTDGILLVVSRHWRSIEVLDGGVRVRCGPGAVGAWVNAALAPLGRRIGPDPASLQAAEVGGIVANNASGMCCGVAENSYRTVESLDLVLADGLRLNTADPAADERLRNERPAIHAGLLELRREVLADQALCERVRKAFETKNTVGYRLDAFLDAETPSGILRRLVVGSEGTLAFLASATFTALPLPRCRATAFLLFPTVEDAGAAVAPLADSGVAAAELLDAVALRRVAEKLPDAMPEGEPAALLVEFQEDSEERLAARLERGAKVLAACRLVRPAAFTRDAALQARYWTVRKGLFPSVGAVRAARTAVVIEDITFPVARLAEGVRSLRALFSRHGYDDAVIFGHAKDGNLHFTLTPDFTLKPEVERYDAFMRDLARMVLDFGGHLKAEHGTGRNMAPWVEAQWGPGVVALMRRIKKLLDPEGILNPGVVLTDDAQSHLRNLKTLTPADPLVDRCIECGFCEPTCPSRDYTMSPRQRIVALRVAAAGGAEGDAVRRVLRERVVDSCAADGSCSMACPVGIDTGDVVRALRAALRGPLARTVASICERHAAAIVWSGRLALRVFGGLRLPGRTVPLMPAGKALPRHWPAAAAGQPTYVFVPTCLNRLFGPDDVPASLAKLCAAAGVGLTVPPEATRLCCGQPFSSKGFPEQAREAAVRLLRAADATSGRTPGGCAGLVIDTSACAAHLLKIILDAPEADVLKRLPLLHPAAFAVQVLLPRLQGRLRPQAGRVAIHPTCSESRKEWVGELLIAARAVAPEAFIPAESGCCGMAGDKGWSVPGLTRAATRREADAVRGTLLGLATGSTCAANLSAHSGVPYRHLLAAMADALES